MKIGAQELDVSGDLNKEKEPMEDEHDGSESSIEEILEDEEGNFYIMDSKGNLVPYELPAHLENLKL